jgi:hypothetical protein
LLRNRARVVAGSPTDRITQVGQGPCSAREWPASPLSLHVAEHHSALGHATAPGRSCRTIRSPRAVLEVDVPGWEWASLTSLLAWLTRAERPRDPVRRRRRARRAGRCRLCSRAGDGAVLAHPGDRYGGVEAAGEREANLLAARQVAENCGHGLNPWARWSACSPGVLVAGTLATRTRLRLPHNPCDHVLPHHCRGCDQVFVAVAVAVADGDGVAYPYSVLGFAATNAGMVSVWSAFPSAATPATSTTSID